MKTKKSLYKVTLTAIFAGLAFVGTMIHIPLPTGGMIHLGNFVVILAALLCGGLVGGISGGIGCGLYDLLIYSSWDGFIKYLILKFIMGMIVGYTFRFILKRKDKFKVSLCLFISGLAFILFTSLVLILYSFNLITIKYQNPTGYLAIVSILAYILGALLIFAGFFSLKLTKIHKIVLCSISISIVVNLILEFFAKIITSLTIDALSFDASLVKGFSTMPSCILTGGVALVLATLIYPPVFQATKNLNYLNDIPESDSEEHQ